MSYQGHVENGMVIPDQPVPLPNGTPVRIEPILPSSDEFWESPSFEELVRRQGTKPIVSAEQLAGGWPEDELDDGFEEAVREWRNRELESGE